MRKTGFGFSLIELVIAVAIIGILAAIAIPSYQESVRKSRRSEAQQELLGYAQALERYFTNNNTYAGADAANIYATNVPASGTVRYVLRLEILNGGADYRITAARAGGGQETDACGDFVLTANGRRSVTGNTLSLADCWRS